MTVHSRKNQFEETNFVSTVIRKAIGVQYQRDLFFIPTGTGYRLRLLQKMGSILLAITDQRAPHSKFIKASLLNNSGSFPMIGCCTINAIVVLIAS